MHEYPDNLPYHADGPSPGPDMRDICPHCGSDDMSYRRPDDYSQRANGWTCETCGSEFPDAGPLDFAVGAKKAVA